MYSTVRPDKELAKRLVVQWASEYVQLFREAQRPQGWRLVARGVDSLRKSWRIDGYVALYDSEIRLYNCFMVGALGIEGARQLGAYLQSLPPHELQSEANEFTRFVTENPEWLDEAFPEEPAKLQRVVEGFRAMPVDEQAEMAKRVQFLICAGLAFFYNAISVMVHGEKLTSLVPKALDGDQEAFLKAVHVDKTLLHAHPRFKERYEEAMVNGDAGFLRNLGYRLGASPTKGPIRFPGLYFIFAMLEALGWLDELRHEEILDVCDAARLDRWQNRIEDLNAVTKQLRRYRRMQALGGLSMH